MNRVASLAGLRAVAAYTVLLAHIVDFDLRGDALAQDFAGRLAHLGMSLFFVLSGFVIHYNYAGTVKTGRGLIAFFVARFARLYPMYFVVLAVYASIRLDTVTGWIAATHLTMTQSWFNTQEAFLTATWSISTEWFFYIGFAVLATGGFLDRIRNPLGSAYVFVAGTAIFLILAFTCETPIVYWLTHAGGGIFSHGDASAPPWYWLIYHSPWVRFFEFALGVLVSMVYRAGPPRIGNWAGAAAILWCLLLVAPIDLGSRLWADFLFNFAWAPAIAIVVLHSCQDGNRVSSALKHPVMVWLGEITYSVYLLQFLCHNTVHLVVQNIVADIVVTFAALTLLAFLTYRTIEAPARQLIRRKADELIRRTPRYAAAAVPPEA